MKNLFQPSIKHCTLPAPKSKDQGVWNRWWAKQIAIVCEDHPLAKKEKKLPPLNRKPGIKLIEWVNNHFVLHVTDGSQMNVAKLVSVHHEDGTKYEAYDQLWPDYRSKKERLQFQAAEHIRFCEAEEKRASGIVSAQQLQYTPSVETSAIMATSTESHKVSSTVPIKRETKQGETMSEDNAVAVEEEVKAPKAKKVKKSVSHAKANRKINMVEKAAKVHSNGDAHKHVGELIGGLNEGSTRARLFKALKRFPMGLSAKQIKEKTGMLPVSGHLAVILDKELEAKRIRKEVHEGTENNRDVILYFLTAKGKADIEKGKVEDRIAGVRIGQKWSKAKRAAHS